ncbi:MAG: FtsX-like permease family protein [Ferruginibacter sp.]
MYLTFAWRYFKAKKSANAINIIAWVTAAVIAFATMCQVLVLSVFNGFEGLVKSLYGNFYTDVKIIPASGKTFLMTAEQISSLKRQPGIAALSMIAEEKGLLQNEDKQTLISLKGVEDNYSEVSGVAAATRRGSFETGTADDPGIVVGIGIQESAELSVDKSLPSSKVVIILPKKGTRNFINPVESLNQGNATATGAFSIQQDFDSRYALTNIDFVKQQMGFAADEFSAAEIKLKDVTQAEPIAATLKKALGDQYTVQTKYEQNMSLYTTMKMEKWAIFAILTLIFIIASFNMVSALTMLVLEKQKDISVLQSMGAGRPMIQKIFLSEGLLLGLIGLGIGIFLAVIICVLQIKFKLIKLQGGSFLIDYFPVKLVATDFLLVAASAFIIALLASWFPSRKAARQAFELR